MKFVQARNYTKADRKKIDLIVFHDMEYPERNTGAEWCADFFAAAAAPKASAHYCVDNDTAVQCVRDEDVAWHAPGANNNGIGIEHAGYAKQTRAEWLDEYGLAMLEISAELVAGLCRKYGIPAERPTVEQLKAGARGIVGHKDCTDAFAKGKGHYDPGPFFPWDYYLDRVRAHLVLSAGSAEEWAGGELADWPIVSVGTSRWHVSPSYIWPIGIGAAEETAKRLDCELPSLELVNAIWRAADVKLSPVTRSPENGLLADWGPSMAALETYNDQARRIEEQVAGRAYKLLAGVCKDVVLHDGRLGLYGWHRQDGTIVQPFYGGHARGWIDYSQGLRLCRRII